MRRILSGIALLLALGATACSTAESIFTSTGSLKAQPLDLTVSTQTSATPSNQFEKWTVAKAEVDVPGLGTVNLLTQPSCLQVQQLFSLSQTTGATCRLNLTGVALEAGTTGTLTVRLDISDLWVTRAERPALSRTGDVDHDTKPDEEDNCPYVPNSDQSNANAADEGANPVGDACTNANGAKDSDADGVADVSDNCVYVGNGSALEQSARSTTDGFVDTVGEACAHRIHVTLPGPRLVLQRTVPFTIRDGGVTFLNFNFQSNVWCPQDPEHEASCAIQPDDVLLQVQ